MVSHTELYTYTIMLCAVITLVILAVTGNKK